jgi:propanol-preferring alcohol dehydrogenase
MRAMGLRRPGEPLVMVSRPDPVPAKDQVRVRIGACGVCRTDLHVVDGDLPVRKSPVVPGHEVVGYVEAIGPVVELSIGQRDGIPWLGQACGGCEYCGGGRENLCDDPTFTGYTRDGGYSTNAIADGRYVVRLPEHGDERRDLRRAAGSGRAGAFVTSGSSSRAFAKVSAGEPQACWKR